MRHTFSKTAICVLAGLASSAAFASSVEVYGVVDAYVQYYNTGSDSIVDMGSGGKGGSRWGIKGNESLGNGNSIFFRLENGFMVDTGVNTPSGGDPSGWAFQREAVLGSQGQWGTLSVGRQYTLNFGNVAMFDAFAVSLGSTINNFMAPAPFSKASEKPVEQDIHQPGINGSAGANNLTRSNNSLIYSTPNMGGLTLTGMIALGESDKPASNTIGNLYSLQAVYRGGAFAAGLAWTLYDNQAAATSHPAIKSRNKDNLVNFGASYDFGVTKAYFNFVYKASQTATESDPDLYVIGGSLKTPLAGGYLLNGFHYLHNNTTDKANALNVSVRYDYPLSKRTWVYGGAAYMNNQRNVNYNINGGGGTSAAPSGEFGKDPWTIFVGMNHSF